MEWSSDVCLVVYSDVCVVVYSDVCVVVYSDVCVVVYSDVCVVEYSDVRVVVYSDVCVCAVPGSTAWSGREKWTRHAKLRDHCPVWSQLTRSFV